MNSPDGAAGQPAGPLFHVATRPIPVGRVLQPYAVAQDYPTLLRSAEQALDTGPGAVRLLLGSAAWGNLLGQRDHRAAMVLLEAVFERARRRISPEQPSRLEAVFVWRTLDLARRFRAEYRPDGIIHRCALIAGTAVERDGALVVAAYEAADLANPSAEDLRRVEARAEEYWQAQTPMTLPELLVRGTVAVEAVVKRGEEDRRR